MMDAEGVHGGQSKNQFYFEVEMGGQNISEVYLHKHAVLLQRMYTLLQ